MSRFNVRTLLATGTSAIRSMPATARTAEGARGFERDPRSELFLLAISSMVGEGSFYEAGDERDNRLRCLAATVAVADPDWTGRFVGWLRTGALIRTGAIVVAAEAVHARLAAGLAGGNRAMVASVLQRPDEPAEFIAYWHSRFGRALPQPVKRGVADGARRLYTQRSLVKYDGSGRAIRFADVLELTHPVPRDDRQSALFRHALERRHGRDTAPGPLLSVLRRQQELLAVPAQHRRAVLEAPNAKLRLAAAGFTWEQVAGWLGAELDAVVWESIIPSMGYMALLRNLRNFDRAGVSDAVAAQVGARLADPAEVARSRQLPLRFLAAHRHAPSLRWGAALEQALSASLSGVPELPGRTLVLVDRSGSMTWGRLSRDGTISFADGAGVFGAALALRAQRSDLVVFGSGSAVVPLRRGDSVLRIAAAMGDLGGTDTARAVRRHYAGHDRVVIITDEQASWSGGDPTSAVPRRVPVYTFNLAGYRYGHGASGEGAPQRHVFGGLTDAGFAMLALLERGRQAGWPF